MSFRVVLLTNDSNHGRRLLEAVRARGIRFDAAATLPLQPAAGAAATLTLSLPCDHSRGAYANAAGPERVARKSTWLGRFLTLCRTRRYHSPFDPAFVFPPFIGFTPLTDSLIRPDPATAGPVRPKLAWVSPEVTDLGHMADLTLQLGSPQIIDCPVDNPFCFVSGI